MTTTYTLKQNAIRAAKAAAKKAGSDWMLQGSEGAWTYALTTFDSDEVAPKQIDADPHGFQQVADEATARFAALPEAAQQAKLAEVAALDATLRMERATAEVELTATLPASALFPAFPAHIPDSATTGDEEGTDADDGHERGADEVLGGMSRAEALGVDPALWDHGTQADNDRAQDELDAAMGATGSEMGLDPRGFGEADLIRAARATAAQRADSDQRVSWLLMEMADALQRHQGTAKAPKAAKEPKAPKAERTRTTPAQKAGTPTTTKPIINSPTNQVVARLVDRIEAARGDLEALEAMTFKAGNTYYAKAAAYRDGLIAEARAAQEA